MSNDTQGYPSPFATHADLSALRREIQLDMRQEVRDMVHEIKNEIRNMKAERVTNKQWLVTTLISSSSIIVAAWAMWGH